LFTVLDVELEKNPSCTQTINSKHLSKEGAKYFDKDGFELTPLEQAYYVAAGYQNHLGTGTLYHTCWQSPWFTLNEGTNYILDHSMILHRCDFQDDALIQLYKYSKKLPQLNYLIQCKKKWGLDFSLDFIDNKTHQIYEVVHIEQDTFNFEHFLQLKNKFETFVTSTDWDHAVTKLISHKDKWLPLEGMQRNDWKAKFFGYSQSETTLKTI